MRPKFTAIREVIAIPEFHLEEAASVWANLPKPRKEIRPKWMESYDQPHGCVLYRTKLPAGSGERLVITEWLRGQDLNL